MLEHVTKSAQRHWEGHNKFMKSFLKRVMLLAMINVAVVSCSNDENHKIDAHALSPEELLYVELGDCLIASGRRTNIGMRDSDIQMIDEAVKEIFKNGINHNKVIATADKIDEVEKYAFDKSSSDRFNIIISCNFAYRTLFEIMVDYKFNNKETWDILYDRRSADSKMRAKVIRYWNLVPHNEPLGTHK